MLDEDRQITVVAYRSPAVIVTVKTEGGQVPDDLQVSAGFTPTAEAMANPSHSSRMADIVARA